MLRAPRSVATVGGEALVNARLESFPFVCLDDLCPGGSPIYLPYASSSLLGLATGKSWQEFREREKGDQALNSMIFSQKVVSQCQCLPRAACSFQWHPLPEPLPLESGIGDNLTAGRSKPCIFVNPAAVNRPPWKCLILTLQFSVRTPTPLIP